MAGRSASDFALAGPPTRDRLAWKGLSLAFRATESARVRVLVVDDQRFWRNQLRDILEGAGHEVRVADGGEAAWETLTRDRGVDILLTDWEMPGFGGIELCRRVRAADLGFHLPILILTSRRSSEDLVQALDAGADAFLNKPFEPAELLAQLRVAERVLHLEAKLDRRIEELTAAKARIERELAHAGAVQRSLLPSRTLSHPGVEFSWVYEPCAQLGGDVFNVIPLDDRHVAAYVLDVSGHGTTAALHSVSVTHVLRPLPRRSGFLRRFGPDGASEILRPAEVAAELNRRFPLMEISGHYFTFLYGILDLETLRFRYTRAGHPPPIRIRGDEARICDPGGDLPVGVTDEAQYRDFELALEPGDSLILTTDGVHETTNEAGNELGTEGLLATLSGRGGQSIHSTVQGLGAALEDYRKLEAPRDDVTVLGLKVV